MPTVIWIILGVVVLGALFGGTSRRNGNGDMDDDDPDRETEEEIEEEEWDEEDGL